MKKILTLSLCVWFITSGFAFAACPSADLTGDCFVNLKDFALMANLWLTVYDWNDVNTLANQWQTWAFRQVISTLERYLWTAALSVTISWNVKHIIL
jgi:hypothetical protein